MTRRTLFATFMAAVVALPAPALAFSPQPQPNHLRAYVITGQGGRITSGGMVSLASSIKQIPNTVVSIHPWKYPNIIARDIKRLSSSTKIAIVGYSLGANATTWVSKAVYPRKVDLIVAYDPSIYSIVTPAPRNVVRGVLYHNNGRSMLGHAVIPGPQMVTVEVSQGHLSVDYNRNLHQRTLTELRRLTR